MRYLVVIEKGPSSYGAHVPDRAQEAVLPRGGQRHTRFPQVTRRQNQIGTGGRTTSVCAICHQPQPKDLPTDLTNTA